MADVFELFRVDIVDDTGGVTLRVRGDLDLATAPVLGEHLRSATEDHSGDVDVDLSEVDFLDSTALDVLVAAHQRLRAADRRLTVSSVSTFADKVLKISGLAEMLDAPAPSDEPVAD